MYIFGFVNLTKVNYEVCVLDYFNFLLHLKHKQHEKKEAYMINDIHMGQM